MNPSEKAKMNQVMVVLSNNAILQKYRTGKISEPIAGKSVAGIGKFFGFSSTFVSCFRGILALGANTSNHDHATFRAFSFGFLFLRQRCPFHPYCELHSFMRHKPRPD